MRKLLLIVCVIMLFFSCESKNDETQEKKEVSKVSYRRINRSVYKDQLQGFWLGQCIANWTGLVTEMDKVGNIGEFKTGDFYTREDWGKPDKPSIWGQGVPSNLSENIDFVFRDTNEIWGSDDDTDIEYIYQYVMDSLGVTKFTANDIRNAWMNHIKKEEENFLWVSNDTALKLMMSGKMPPETSDPKYNPHYEMIDAQLTTEIFGFYAPAAPNKALEIARLPIYTTARGNAAWASEFYVIMYSLASEIDNAKPIKENIHWMADQARKRLPNNSYSALMYDFVKSEYDKGTKWETVRDSLYSRYQVNQKDGYNITSQKIYCNGCFASGINFASSIISLLYGEGNIKETIKIGALCGWDSDNPTATWGGLLGFMLGKEGVEETFGRAFSNKFNIHRTRINFPNDGIDTFEAMADAGVRIVNRVVVKELNGSIDTEKNEWVIPIQKLDIVPGKENY